MKTEKGYTTKSILFFFVQYILVVIAYYIDYDAPQGASILKLE